MSWQVKTLVGELQMRSNMLLDGWFIQLLQASPPHVLLESLGNQSVSPLLPCGYSSLNHWPDGWPAPTHPQDHTCQEAWVDSCAELCRGATAPVNA